MNLQDTDKSVFNYIWLLLFVNYHDYARDTNVIFPLKNILGFSNINKSTLGLIAWSYSIGIK